jgi:hypothetical protein
VPTHFGDSHRLSSKVMSLPCDQRYQVEDMSRLATEFRSALDSVRC